MKITTIFNIEFLKLFRQSNILFFFLFIYLMITPIQAPFLFSFTEESAFEVENFYSTMVNSISVMGLLLMAIFMVNSIGNDFNEGSYRKMIAVGFDKKYYFMGKLLLIILFSILVILTGILSYMLIGLFALKLALFDLLKSIQLFSIINQLFALIQAGLFGVFFIVVFRNRIIGLVFFPFWFITEFAFYLIDKSGARTILINYWPGTSIWNLFICNSFDISKTLIFLLYSLFFLYFAWFSIKNREEKATK